MSAGETYVYLEIAEAVRRLIVSGEMPAGARLPSVRDMAERWRCTPNTVSRAYAHLAREGLLTARRGGGTRVASFRPDSSHQQPAGWEWANLVNRAESYLLEAMAQGHNPAHAEAALAAAISRWRELQEHPTGRAAVEAVDHGRPTGGLAFSGSHDLAVELLVRMLAGHRPPVELRTSFVGSLGGLIALARDEADISGTHLWDQATGEYNVPFVQRLMPNRSVVLLTLVTRIQGLIVPAGNPQELVSLVDLTKPHVRLVNRQPGSGTRVWLDGQLKESGIFPGAIAGYEDEETTHLGVARAVAEGSATVGLGVSAAAAAYGLDFVPLKEERYDLVVPMASWDDEDVVALPEVDRSTRFKDAVMALGGYDVSATGRETHLG
jgi:molybdate-binding protein/DNA-binding transcriptional regulator YhcF (GntR family)